MYSLIAWADILFVIIMGFWLRPWLNLNASK